MLFECMVQSLHLFDNYELLVFILLLFFLTEPDISSN